LKTAVLNLVNNLQHQKKPFNKADVACSFQKIAIAQLKRQTVKALQNFAVKQLVVSGGVSANSHLRKVFKDLKIKVIFPALEHCTDNAAMIAKIAHLKYQKKLFANLLTKALPNEKIRQ